MRFMRYFRDQNYFSAPLFLTATFISLFSMEAFSQASSNATRNEKFFSGRTQTIAKQVVLVRLEAPSLVADRYMRLGPAAVREDLQLDETLEAHIEAEQARLESELQKLSSDIRVLFRYKYLMNALAVVTPSEFVDAIERFDAVQEVRPTTHFFNPPETVLVGPSDGRPLIDSKSKSLPSAFDQHNQTDEWYTSTTHIFAHYAYAQGIRGQGIRVGVIDSGIDYTHSMFAGPGDPAVYASLDGLNPGEYFPNSKVRGGIDLVGDDFNPRSFLSGVNIPRPDLDPLDVGGHGTHVAGSIAGIGDGHQTYDGVAPDAELYAIRVFGSGSTNDVVVAQGLEYAMDPHFNGDTSERLDVINLSLGGNYGKPQGTYAEVLKNATRAGIVVVASAGNSGDVPFVVGSPSTTDEAISVGASIDGMDHNWRFPTVDFTSLNDGTHWSSKVVEANFTRPVARSRNVSANLVYGGLAAEPFTGELAEKMSGSIALIIRGEVSFADKIKHAYQAGAVGVVIYNNQPGAPIPMGGGDDLIDIPAIMIEYELGSELADALNGQGQEILMSFDGQETEERRELVDQLTDFSSRGPRMIDGHLKPEIAAPGQQIISAQVGAGTQGVRLNGTSMSGPHVAGVMALLVQKYPGLTVAQLKDILLNSASLMTEASGGPLSLVGQGAGLANIKKAFNQQIIASPSIVNLGYQDLGSHPLTLERTLTITSLNEKFSEEQIAASVEFSENMSLEFYELRSVPNQPGKFKLDVELTLTPNISELSYHEAVIVLKDSYHNKVLARVPVFGLGRYDAEISMSKSRSGEFLFESASGKSSEVYPFLYMGSDERKPDLDYHGLPVQSRSCDLREVFARVTHNENRGDMLQVAVLIDEPVTIWHTCDVSILFDTNSNGEADFEWLGSMSSTVPGVVAQTSMPDLARGSFLLDANLARELRRAYEESMREYELLPGGLSSVLPEPRLSYAESLVDYGVWTALDHRRLSVMELPLDSLPVNDSGSMEFSLYVSNNYGGFIADDRWGGVETTHTWNLENLRERTLNLPSSIEFSGSHVLDSFLDVESLVFLAPYNSPGNEVLR